MKTNGSTEIALTKRDILWWFKKIPVCYAYKIGNKTIREIPASLSEFRKSKPLYKELEGWGDLTPDMIEKGFNALPQALQDYVKYIEAQVDCKITIISMGPQRHETIIR